jgi:hypothetical protein
MSLHLAQSKTTPDPTSHKAKIGNGRFFYPDHPEWDFTGVHFSGWRKDQWRVTAAYSYRTYHGEIWTVHKGFITDFFSIPKEMQWLYPKVWDDANAAAGLHDWALRQGINRKRCDKVLLTAMRDLGVNAARRRIVYCVVRAYSNYLRVTGRDTDG